MNDDANDDDIVQAISRLVDEEHRIESGSELDADGQERLRAVRERLDQAWDLLRQRRAKREYGGDPDEATLRPASEVEGYHD